MNTEDLRKRISAIDWGQYLGPNCYDPGTVPGAFDALLNFEEGQDWELVVNKILFSIGNNHRGTYYPAMFSAMELLIAIEQDGSNLARKKCAQAILNDLSCFEAEVGEYTGATCQQLSEFASSYLSEYADET